MCLNQYVVEWVVMAEANMDRPKKLVYQACINSFVTTIVSVDGKSPVLLFPHTTNSSVASSVAHGTTALPMDVIRHHRIGSTIVVVSTIVIIVFFNNNMRISSAQCIFEIPLNLKHRVCD
jgi:hypothetical protein